jgi:hypothetical protein
MNYYFDIETTGIDPVKCQIISVQVVGLAQNAGTVCRPFKMFKAWELGEKGMLEKALEYVEAYDPYPFKFIPVGYNLDFEDRFISTRMDILGMKRLPMGVVSYERPRIDLRPIGAILCKGEFKGSSLTVISGKKGTGKDVLEFYQNGQFDKIEEYAKQEAEEYIRFLDWLFKVLPPEHVKFLEKTAQDRAYMEKVAAEKRAEDERKQAEYEKRVQAEAEETVRKAEACGMPVDHSDETGAETHDNGA